jgi:uncharacterized protein YjiK
MLTFKDVYTFFVAAALAVSLAGCKGLGKKERFADSDMYEFSKPTIIKLPEALDEISGIAYYPKDTSIFAIIDEDGLLFKVPIMRPNAIKQWRFDKKRDYEDLVLIDSIFYALVSNGDIERIEFKDNTIHIKKSNFSDRSKKANEFESLYYNADLNKLVLICKECEEDTKKTFTSYIFRDSSMTYENYMVMDGTPAAKKLGLDKAHFKATAAAINPATEQLYIISAVNHLLIIASNKGEIKEVFKLDPGIYKQPEGMAFTPEGDLIISNEYAELGFATLLILKNKLKGR